MSYTSIAQAYFRGKLDAQDDWANDTIKDEFKEDTTLDKMYARTYAETIKQLSLKETIEGNY